MNKNANEDRRSCFLRGYYRGTGTWVVQEGRGGYGPHTVKNWCAGRARGAQGRDRSEGRAKWWTRGKTKKQKKPVEKKKKIFGPSTLHENRPPSPTKKTLRVYLRTTCTSGKGLYAHNRSTCVLYRNIVSTRVCANNFFSVVQNGSAVVPWHYRDREGKVLQSVWERRPPNKENFTSFSIK